jgi:predicted negative regulator of RcsB-dependent stress response
VKPAQTRHSSKFLLAARDFELVFLCVARKIARLFMQTQDATAIYLFKLWPWIENNKKRILIGAGIIITAIFIFYFAASQRAQKEIDAGKALTDAVIATGGGQSADAYLKISADYPATLAGQRAALQAAGVMFAAGRYADAQEQFQKFIDAHPDSAFSSQATLGVAASLDAQSKQDLAVAAYQKAIGPSDATTTSIAKLATARIYESQGKLKDAFTLYEDVARSNPGGTLGSEAAVRAMELQTKLPAVPVSTAPANSFKLNQ